MFSIGTGVSPAVSVLVPVIDRSDLTGLRRRVDELDLALQQTVASYEIVVILDGLTCPDLDDRGLPASVLVRHRARRGGRRRVLGEGARLTRGVILVVIDGAARVGPRRLQSLLLPIKGGVDVVTGVDVDESAGGWVRGWARAQAWIRGRFGLSGGLRACRRHAWAAAMGARADRPAAGCRFAAVAV